MALEQLTAHDWQSFASEEQHATRMPHLLRNYLRGNLARARKASRAIWLALAGADGYIDSPGLVSLTAVALTEVIPDLGPTGRF
jgi:hypothetical protein